MTTVADIGIGETFYMDVAGQQNYPFIRISETEISCKKMNSPGNMTMTASLIWEAKSKEEYEAELERKAARARYTNVPGHSSEWPWGEH